MLVDLILLVEETPVAFVHTTTISLLSLPYYPSPVFHPVPLHFLTFSAI